VRFEVDVEMPERNVHAGGGRWNAERSVHAGKEGGSM
jgi:hypothetical protein